MTKPKIKPDDVGVNNFEILQQINFKYLDESGLIEIHSLTN